MRLSSRCSRRLGGVAAVVLLVAGCAQTTDEPRPGPSDLASQDHYTDGHTHDGDDAHGDGHDHDLVTESADLPGWSPIEGLAVPRDDFATAVVDDEIWAMGGMTGDRGNRLTSIEVLDTSDDTWRTSEIELPRGLASFEAVSVGPRVFTFGGFGVDARPTGYSAVLDTRTGRWQRLPAVPHPRYAHTATLHDGKVYVIGGRGPDGPVAEVDVFDPARRSWETLETPMPAARDSHKTVSTPEGLLVVGGWLGDGPTDRVDAFDPASDRWTRGPSLPVNMSRAGVAVAQDKVWVSLHRTSYVIDAAVDGEWRPANAPPLSRHGLGFVPVGGALYAIGGCAESPLRDVRTVDRLDFA